MLMRDEALSLYGTVVATALAVGAVLCLIRWAL